MNNDVTAIQWLIDQLFAERENHGPLSAAFVRATYDKVHAIRDRGVEAFSEKPKKRLIVWLHRDADCDYVTTRLLGVCGVAQVDEPREDK